MSASLDVNNLPWLSLVKAKQVRRVRTYFTIPVFQFEYVAWIRASYPLGMVNYSLSNNFTIATLPVPDIGVNYVPTIKWRQGGIVHRYKLWDHPDVVLYAPIYRGQKIGKNFQLEIWNISSSLAMTQLVPINVFTSIRPVPSIYTGSDTNIALAQGVVVAGAQINVRLLVDTLPWTFTDTMIGADNP